MNNHYLLYMKYILHLTYTFVERNIVQNRDQLTPFSDSLESSSSPDAHSLTRLGANNVYKPCLAQARSRIC